MPNLSFKFALNKGISLAFSVEELNSILTLPNITAVKDLSNDDKTFFLLAAQEELETFLGIKLLPQIVEETRDYHIGDIIEWNFIPVSFPVNEICSIEGFYGTERAISVESQYFSVKRGEGVPWRQMHLVPNWYGSTGIQYFGNYYGYGYGFNRVTNFWKVKYKTGFTIIPKDLALFVYKYAAINILVSLSSGVYRGNNIPVSSGSVSIDGLGQSYSSLLSGGALLYSPIINQYIQDLQQAQEILIPKYRGITFTSL